MSPEEKLIRIVSVVPTSSEIVFDHVSEKTGDDIYHATQEYPHVLDMHNPFTYERVCIVVDKIDGKIVRSDVQFKDEELNEK